jgi:hypothetical protein
VTCKGSLSHVLASACLTIGSAIVKAIGHPLDIRIPFEKVEWVLQRHDVLQDSNKIYQQHGLLVWPQY